MRIEIYQIDDELFFGYRIIDESQNIYIDQPFKPGSPGFVKMTKGEAEAEAAMQAAVI